MADAPSRAPWEAALARHLPIPDLPLRELIRKMYASPEAWARMVNKRAQDINLDSWNALEADLHPDVPKFGEAEVRKSVPKGESDGELSLIHISEPTRPY